MKSQIFLLRYIHVQVSLLLTCSLICRVMRVSTIYPTGGGVTTWELDQVLLCIYIHVTIL